MPKGNIPLMDALAALVVAIVLNALIINYTSNEGFKSLQEGIETEGIRSEFYTVLFSGEMPEALNSSQADIYVGALHMSLGMAPDKPSIRFFISTEGGIKQFRIMRRD